MTAIEFLTTRSARATELGIDGRDEDRQPGHRALTREEWAMIDAIPAEPWVQFAGEWRPFVRQLIVGMAQHALRTCQGALVRHGDNQLVLIQLGSVRRISLSSVQQCRATA
jgi:hypothetical protein